MTSWLLPDGVDELLPPTAEQVEQLRRKVLDLFAEHNYRLVSPPLVEFLESLLTGAGNDLDLKTFKLTDQISGRSMGVRADITPQIARIDAHRLRSDDVTRLCYAGETLQTTNNGFSAGRSQLQAGIELYGEAKVTGDIEVIKIMLDTLSCAGIETKDVTIDLGHVEVYRVLAKLADLTATVEKDLFKAVQCKSLVDLDLLLQQHNVSAQVVKAFRALLELNGTEQNIITQAKEKFSELQSAELDNALNELSEVISTVQEQMSCNIHVDLAELRGYSYHTGVLFAVYLAGHGDAIAKGGRYDNVGEVFMDDKRSKKRPATGFSIDLKSVYRVTNRNFQNIRG